MMEKTLSIIKPDAVSRHLIGEIIHIFEKNNIMIRALQLKNLTVDEAQRFYKEHSGKSFYDSLVKYMTSGPVVLMILEGNNVIERNREIMGQTNPLNAAEGTIRKKYAESIERNSVHGSDSQKSAQREIHFFFPNML